MGFSESDSSKCRKHPNLKQLPGICSSCLREKLSKLSTNSPSFNNRKFTTTFISSSSSFSSTPPYSTASTASTTTVTWKSPGSNHRRNGSEAVLSVGVVLNDGLKKSKSVSGASISRTKVGNIVCVRNEKVFGKLNNKGFLDGGKILEDGNLKKKNGFLKKLIHNTSKKTKGVLTHSKTMKETSYNNNSCFSPTIKNKNY